MTTRIPNLTIEPDYDNLIETGDMSVAVTYRLTYASGETQESAPRVLVNGLRADNVGTGSASGQWLMIPTLRHLMPGTTAQIVVYLEGASTLQRFYVLENDPTIDYIEFSPNALYIAGGIMATVTEAMQEAGISTDPDQPLGTEALYTTGNNLPNDPPPQLDCICQWRNRMIGAFQNTIFVSQEFAQGRGVLFTSYQNVQWLDGTGDIVAVCPIDWNYLAVFKQDAIGVISGPGPDGMGHGNYIVQTLPTRMGCSNPLSIVNGGGGAYFQDASTKRIGVITGQLQAQEATPGWFNEGLYTVTAAMQVEQRRQVWFATTEKAIVVLDYKHGRTFIWDLSAYNSNIIGIAMVGVYPTAMLANGKTIAYVESQAYDSLVASAVITYSAINRTIETGELQPNGLMGAFDVSRVVVLGEFIGAHTWTLDVIPQFGSAGTPKTATITAAPEQFDCRPPSCQRVQSVRVKLTEGTYAPGGAPAYTKGSKFIGLGLEIQPRDRLQRMNTGRSY